MGETKRDDEKKSVDHFGEKADSLDQKTMAYLQGFLACAATMSAKEEPAKKPEGEKK